MPIEHDCVAYTPLYAVHMRCTQCTSGSQRKDRLHGNYDRCLHLITHINNSIVIIRHFIVTYISGSPNYYPYVCSFPTELCPKSFTVKVNNANLLPPDATSRSKPSPLSHYIVTKLRTVSNRFSVYAHAQVHQCGVLTLNS